MRIVTRSLAAANAIPAGNTSNTTIVTSTFASLLPAAGPIRSGSRVLSATPAGFPANEADQQHTRRKR
jgi:hypothetical protein